MESFERGVSAGLIGEDPRLCPYELGLESQAWHRGHNWGVRYIELFHGGFE